MTQPALAISTDCPIREQLRSRIESEAVDLPVLPAAAQAVLRMTADPNANARELAAKISGDPALSAHVLRIANSALYAGGYTLTSVRQAVGRLGMDLIGQIAASVAVRSTAFENRRFEQVLGELWSRSLRRGLCAREIARLRRDSIEHAFLGGLVRDLGQACVYRELDRMGPAARKLAIEQAQDAALAFGHAAGAALAARWELVPEIARPMSEPFALKGADLTSLAVELGDCMAPLLDAEPREVSARLVEHPAWSRVDLGASDLTKLVSARERILNTAQTMS